MVTTGDHDVFVVRGGHVVGARAVERRDVVVSGGRIVDVLPPGSSPLPRGLVVDADGLLVLPGAVDPHVHFNEPGRTAWEGFDTGSAAAAAGGVTTVVDMPIDSDPPTTTARLVQAKAACAERSSRVDVALWGGLVPSSVTRLDELAEAGVVGFKAFACPSGWDDFPEVDEPSLRAGLAASAVTGLPVALHAELEAFGHTPASELAAVRWAAELAAEVGGHLHVVHVASADAVREAKRWPNVTVETCPHYLALTEADAARIGAEARCNPPIGSAANQADLWKLLLGGSIDCLASDHSPCPDGHKDGDDPWAGITGVETLLPVLLSTRHLPVVELARLTTAAATLLALPGKGRIAPGYDADLALVDPDAIWTVGPGSLWNRHHRSPFTSRTLRGRVVRTLVRGRTVFDLERGPSEPGGGRIVRPDRARQPVA